MDQYFHETIHNWDDWGRVYQSIPAFAPLAREVFRREKLPWTPLAPLTPGTNAVFRAGDYVVKVFFPRESGLDPDPDFHNEAAVCRRLTELSLPTPRLIAQGQIRDKYDFYYLVTEYFPGEEAGDWLRAASPEQKRDFVRQLQDILKVLNQPAEGLLRPMDLLERALHNPRLEKLPPTLREDLRARARSLDLSHPVLVHGDLTGENLLVSDTGRLVVIDCADACPAPAWYELAPLVFGLFDCDPFLLGLFAGAEKTAFVERVLDAVSIHDFGADILRETARLKHLRDFTRLDEVRQFLLERV